MVTNFILFISIWSSLSFVGGILMLLRDDSSKLIHDAEFIMTKGTFLHKITYVVIAILLLPFSIPKSIQNLLNN